MDQKINSIKICVQEISEIAKKQIEVISKDLFEKNKDVLRTVTLKDDKTKETKTEQIDISLEVKHLENSVEINILAPTKIQENALRGQYRGTGKQVSESILKFFGFKKEQINDAFKEQKYFDPNGADIHFVEKLRTLIGGKPQVP